MCKTVLILFAFLLKPSLTCAVRIFVEKCSVTKTAWEARSQIFTCIPPSVYHCIQDEERNLMETCMEPYRVDPSREDGCPWSSYYRNGDSILGGVFYSCTGIGCPQKNDSVYWTNELYKYPVCLNHHNELTEVTDSTSSPSLDTNKNESDGDQTVMIAVVVLLIIVGVIAAAVIAVILCRRIRHRRKSKDGNDVKLNDSIRTPFIRVVSNTGGSESANGHTSNGVNVMNDSFPCKSVSLDSDVDSSKCSFLRNNEGNHGDNVELNDSIWTPFIRVVSNTVGSEPANAISVMSGISTCNAVSLDSGVDSSKCSFLRNNEGKQKSISSNGLPRENLDLGNQSQKHWKDASDTVDKHGGSAIRSRGHEGETNLMKSSSDVFEDKQYINNSQLNSAFHLAGLSGSVDDVQRLMDNGCNVYSKDCNGLTFAHIACQKGHVNLVKHLIGLDKNILNTEDNNGMTPFHCAGFSGSVELVQYLIDNGCDVYSKDKNGYTIIHYACLTGQIDMVKFLIGQDKKVLNQKDNKGTTPFHLAGHSGSEELVQNLLDNDCELYRKDKRNWTILHYSCNAGHLGIVKLLIGQDRNVLHQTDNNGMTPFHLAGFSGSLELVQYLINNGCDIYTTNHIGRTITHNVCEKGHVEVMKFLMGIKQDVLNIEDFNGMTPFHLSGFSGSVELVHFLTEHKGDIYSKDYDGRTIVHNACSKGCIELVKYLIEKDKEVLYVEDNNKDTPKNLAEYSCSEELVQYLSAIVQK